MDDKSSKKYDKEMVCEPEDLKIWPPNGVCWGCDHDDEGKRDDNSS